MGDDQSNHCPKQQGLRMFFGGFCLLLVFKAGLHQSRDFDTVKLNVWSCECFFSKHEPWCWVWLEETE